MRLNELKPASGSIKTKKRIGRGQGSGKGGTSTKGHKGATARTGYKYKRGFEGGQMPLVRRLPKFGFKPLYKKEFLLLSLHKIEEIVEKYGVSEIDVDFLKSKRILKGRATKVKILAGGDLSKNVSLKVNAISRSAETKLEGQGVRLEKI
jgi:large subunit ribosomal protein L15